VQEPVRKIATLLPVTEEMLEDVPQIQSYANARLIGFVRVTLNTECLSGSGIAPHLLGIMNRALAPAVPQGTMTAVDAIGIQIATLATANEDLYPPDAVIVNPLDLANMLQAKTTTGEYIAASPFASTTATMLWGLPAIPMSGMPAGTALVGAFSTAAQVFLRGPIQVAVTNSHQDWFQKNLVAIRAETRAALAVYRGGAFGLVTGITFGGAVARRAER
jgi:HK97 family phage major capsid protein